jgi:hypothetical protein
MNRILALSLDVGKHDSKMILSGQDIFEMHRVRQDRICP